MTAPCRAELPPNDRVGPLREGAVRISTGGDATAPSGTDPHHSPHGGLSAIPGIGRAGALPAPPGGEAETASDQPCTRRRARRPALPGGRRGRRVPAAATASVPHHWHGHRPAAASSCREVASPDRTSLALRWSPPPRPAGEVSCGSHLVTAQSLVEEVEAVVHQDEAVRTVPGAWQLLNVLPQAPSEWPPVAARRRAPTPRADAG